MARYLLGGWRATAPAALLVIVALLMVTASDALECYQCGQYNEGVGSITPCLIYSEPLGREHLKSCPRASDKYCIKYVSELSVVRDCVADCKEKEVWETRTLCCTEDGCNASTRSASTPFSLLAVAASISMLLLHPSFHLTQIFKH